MKIILSRKGFDSSNGGIPSPILPDGTMLSMPIPSESDTLSFDELKYDRYTYGDILRQLTPNNLHNKYNKKCHLDPDIRKDVRIKPVSDWKPAFGQIGSAQGVLHNKLVEPGDLFLFFGRFRQTGGNLSDGSLRFLKDAPTLHIIYGYMEIGKIISNSNIAENNYIWHPHGYGKRLFDKSNTLYLPSETLSFNKNLCGWGVFDYDPQLVLTLSNKTATWRNIPALMSENTGRKNCTKENGVYYQGVWQEMVLNDNNISEEWGKEVIEQYFVKHDAQQLIQEQEEIICNMIML